MPCYVDPPSNHELAVRDLNKFLDEIGDTKPRIVDEWLCKSRRLTVEQMSQILCEWCRSHKVTGKSLELQMWWRDHQADDARHAAAEAHAIKRKRVAKAALKKLTPEEQAALGLKGE